MLLKEGVLENLLSKTVVNLPWFRCIHTTPNLKISKGVSYNQYVIPRRLVQTACALFLHAFIV